MKMTAKKVFLDIQKEEDWLNEQAYFDFLEQTGISQFLLGLYLLVQTLHSIQERSVPFWFVVTVDVGLMISGMIFFVLWLRKHRKYAMSKDEKDIWEA